jgi:hypothetical protein
MTWRQKLHLLARMLLGLCPLVLAFVDWTSSLAARVMVPLFAVLAVAAVDRDWESALHLGAGVGMLLSLTVLPGRVPRNVQLAIYYAFGAVVLGLVVRSWRERRRRSS